MGEAFQFTGYPPRLALPREVHRSNHSWSGVQSVIGKRVRIIVVDEMDPDMRVGRFWRSSIVGLMSCTIMHTLYISLVRLPHTAGPIVQVSVTYASQLISSC